MAGPGDDVVHRRQADDLAQRARKLRLRAAAPELAHRLARTQKLPGQVDVDDLAPLRQRHVVQRGVLLQPGVVDDDVDAAELGHRALEHDLHLVFVADVGVHRDGLAAGTADVGHDLLGTLLPTCLLYTSRCV